MPLVNSTETAVLTGVLGDHFTEFSRNITVYKSAKQTFSNTGVAVFAGYGNRSVQSNITFTIVSGIYPAIIQYNFNQKVEDFPEIKVPIDKGTVMIKVRQDARDYIENNNKTEKILVDGNTYNVVSRPAPANFLGLIYYRYTLESTN